jgi:hypothetical protein
MIIGDGDLACALKETTWNDRDLLYFASGVSNSSEIRESEYQREKDLLLAQDKHRHIVYFSSLSIFYASGRYQLHKLEMEKLVKENFPHYCIVRLGNISWGCNPNTVINFLKNKIKNNEPYEVQNVYRFVIDKKEFLYWISVIPSWNCEINIPGRIMTVKKIVKKIKAGLF